jgi:hypothetical protein
LQVIAARKHDAVIVGQEHARGAMDRARLLHFSVVGDERKALLVRTNFRRIILPGRR